MGFSPKQNLEIAKQRQLVLALAAQLKEPEGVATTIRETHISWIVLGKDTAYKIKKAVKLDFLDFTDLAGRAEFCREEVRLNRRTAPDLYLGVVPIYGAPSTPTFAAAGSPIEYAVQMRRFDERMLLSALATRNELDANVVRNLANAVARLHLQALPDNADSPFGTFDTICKPVQDNFSTLFDTLKDRDDAGNVERLQTWTVAESARLRLFFADRKAAGAIRDGHGDLHLNNIVVWQGQPTLFDCIEFDPRLRIVDPMNDIAFLLMDLAEHGKPGLANYCLNLYLESTGDYAGLKALRFYYCYRALVRAKIAAIRIGQTDADPQAQSNAQLECERYIEVALAYNQKPQPSLTIVHGLSGSGKTTVTDALLQSYAVVRLRSDVERKRLHGLAADQASDSSLNQGIYADSASQQTYARLAELADMLLTYDMAVLVDATFLLQRDRQLFFELARRHDIPISILNVVARPEICRQRIRSRQDAGRDASEANLEVLTSQLTSVEPFTTAELEVCIDVDTEFAWDADDIGRRCGLSSL